MKRSLLTLLTVASLGGAFATVGADAHAQPAPETTAPAAPAAPNTGARGFKSEAAPTAPARTPEQALDRCIADVERLERDAIGVPYLAAAYVAFFVILAVFFVLVRQRQRKMEAEMAELKQRLARLQGADPEPAQAGAAPLSKVSSP